MNPWCWDSDAGYQKYIVAASLQVHDAIPRPILQEMHMLVDEQQQSGVKIKTREDEYPMVLSGVTDFGGGGGGGEERH